MSAIGSGVTLALCDFETTGVDPDNDLPIEVGILFLDDELRIVRAFDSLIFLPVWRESFWSAVPIHGITLPALTEAPKAETVCKSIAAISSSFKRKPALCSDNAQFEFRFMLRMFQTAGIKFPFHYCAWDTSLFLELTGVGDPKPKHRAMADVGLLYQAMLAAKLKVQR